MTARSSVCLSAAIMTTILAAPTGAQERSPPPEELARAVESVERLDDLRERLAAAFLGEGGVDVDAETFREVCRPVGQRAASLSREHGWEVRQMAVRYRNPAHEPDAKGRLAHRMMQRHGDLEGLWMRDTVDGREGVRYLRRITVRRVCLACHGAREERPEFVRERYPDDRAFGFSAGDLRGVYSVFVPAARRRSRRGSAPDPRAP